VLGTTFLLYESGLCLILATVLETANGGEAYMLTPTLMRIELARIFLFQYFQAVAQKCIHPAFKSTLVRDVGANFKLWR